MDKPTHLIEFEMTLIGRHLNFFGPRQRAAGRLDRSAYTMLSRLSSQGPMSIGQLSEAFGLDTSTVNRQTAALIKSGLAERIPDPDGGIARKFRITDHGSRRLEHDRSEAISALDRIMADWEPEDVAAFARYLERFNTDIESRSPTPWKRPADVRPPAGP
ncbi:MAG: MarR family transcriptional regulator [Rhodococcus sp.]|uniref:MarR family winged helix-turn-helix transcriptional regulator n=1 Tax=Rhodococcus TaxID=1827 RepID=UPI0016A693E4|nr:MULTISPECIES: MarR family transcriptional regulator [Rhodococcus]NLV80916.1 MarR family transcriptional regulator [Rhodococcus sp. (in: high G+C Gram-positive bacteria)]